MYKILIFQSDTSGAKRELSHVFVYALYENQIENFFEAI